MKIFRKFIKQPPVEFDWPPEVAHFEANAPEAIADLKVFRANAADIYHHRGGDEEAIAAHLLGSNWQRFGEIAWLSVIDLRVTGVLEIPSSQLMGLKLHLTGENNPDYQEPVKLAVSETLAPWLSVLLSKEITAEMIAARAHYISRFDTKFRLDILDLVW